MSGDVGAEVAAVLAAHERAALIDAIADGRVADALTKHGPGGDDSLLAQVLRAECVRFVEHLEPALAPLIAVRVEAAKAEAWDEGWAARANYSERRDVPLDWPDHNPHRAALDPGPRPRPPHADASNHPPAPSCGSPSPPAAASSPSTGSRTP